MILKLIVFVVCLVLSDARKLEDPLCVLMNCPTHTTCRVVKECTTDKNCQLVPQCLAKPPQFSHVGVCQIGDPILEMRDGRLGDTYCGPTLPCPESTYCNTELMDTYSTCCRSDPTNPVKPGTCPNVQNPDTFFCEDTCKNDGDCLRDDKCCQAGCKKSCFHPAVENPCDTKVCPGGSYCLSPDLPRCTGPGTCWQVGDCVPCGPQCRKYCPYGFQNDNKGCPICRCKFQPTPTTPNQGYTRNSASLSAQVFKGTSVNPTRPTVNPMWYYFWNYLF